MLRLKIEFAVLILIMFLFAAAPLVLAFIHA